MLRHALRGLRRLSRGTGQTRTRKGRFDRLELRILEANGFGG